MNFKELKTKSENEIRKLLEELRAKNLDLSLKFKLNQLKNVHEAKQIKKDIARILTYLHQLSGKSQQ